MRLFRRAKPAPTPARPKLEVREADTRDLDAILMLLEELVADRVPKKGRPRYMKAIREEQREMMLDPDARWFVAVRGNERVGCARVRVHGEHPLLAYLDQHSYGYVFGLFVKSEERRGGAGKLLIARCEAWLKARGVSYCFLHSTPVAIPFYERLGYDACLEYGKKL